MKRPSDKIFWHKFDEFYEDRLPIKNVKNILEIGVFNGGSIEYWRKKYKEANIYGIDILEEKESWPKDKCIKYYRLDQSDAIKYNECLTNINKVFDVVIEDGSHDPLHQKISLMNTLPYLQEDSMYILEDIHTSHPNHPLFKNRLQLINESKIFFKKSNVTYHMTLQCLLQIEHLKRCNKPESSLENSIDFSQSLFTIDEMKLIYKKIKRIEIFKRTVLPDYCYSCFKDDFNYTTLKCKCGTDLYLNSDSMTAILYF